MSKKITLKEFYKDYKSKNTDPIYGVDYKTYRSICEDFNKLISDKIINSATEFTLPGRLGSIRIKKIKSSKAQRIDWKKTKENDTKVYHLNWHTDGFYYKWFWHKQKALFKNKSAYSFTPIRRNKRELAKLLKENKVEFFS
tara:strand:+ start:6138 stop:6560 length:423 start_codon:yes stop_codon:yes gene_type:complete